MKHPSVGEAGYRLHPGGTFERHPNCLACDKPLCFIDSRGCPGKPVNGFIPRDENYRKAVVA